MLLEHPSIKCIPEVQKAWQVSCLVAVGQHPKLVGRRSQRRLVKYLKDLVARSRSVLSPPNSTIHPADDDGLARDRWLQLSPLEQKVISILKQLGVKHDVVLYIQGRLDLIAKERDEFIRINPGRMVRGRLGRISPGIVGFIKI